MVLRLSIMDEFLVKCTDGENGSCTLTSHFNELIKQLSSCHVHKILSSLLSGLKSVTKNINTNQEKKRDEVDFSPQTGRNLYYHQKKVIFVMIEISFWFEEDILSILQFTNSILSMHQKHQQLKIETLNLESEEEVNISDGDEKILFEFVKEIVSSSWIYLYHSFNPIIHQSTLLLTVFYSISYKFILHFLYRVKFLRCFQIFLSPSLLLSYPFSQPNFLFNSFQNMMRTTLGMVYKLR